MEAGARNEQRASGRGPKGLPFPTLIAAATAGLVLAAVSPAEGQRRGSSSEDDCAEVVRAARDARSLDDMKVRIERTGKSERELAECRDALQRDSRVSATIEREVQRIRSLAVRQAEVERARYSRSPLELGVNQRVVAARREGSTKVSEVRNRRSEPPSRTPTPAIRTTTPSTLVPGTDVVIEGGGFGNAGGAVELRLQGKVFSATVNDWTDTSISAYLSDEISGVTESSGAVLEIQPQGGSALSRTVPFAPLYESEVINDLPLVLSVWPLAGEAHATAAENWSLDGHWRVVGDPWTTSQGNVSCEIDGPPAASEGSTNLATRVKLEWGYWTLPLCGVFFEIEGPQGFEHGLW